jgi:hypothetical protein
MLLKILKLKLIRTMIFNTIEYYAQQKWGASIFLATILFPVVEFVNEYIFSDWQFGIFLSIAVILDTVLGFIKHYKRGDISSVGFAKLFNKIITYGAVLIITHLLVNFKIGGERNIIFSWFSQVAYSAIMVREAISIIENLGYIKQDLLPPWILRRLKQFDESGNIKDLNPENNNDSE